LVQPLSAKRARGRGSRSGSTLAVALPLYLFAIAAGCGQQTSSEAEVPTARREIVETPAFERPNFTPTRDDVLPGASDVRASLAKQDYDAAVSSLLALRADSLEGEKYTEYMTLYGEVLDTLRRAAGHDRKAAAALAHFDTAVKTR
jgi:hypothetical protein